MATVLSTTWKQLLERALRLSPDERVKIAQALYESVAAEEDDEDEDPAEGEAAWAEEIKQRIEEIRNGTVETIPAEEVMAEMRARFG
ncbi:MAG TPA: addiction module protein [Longimicrobium sp.]|jgi:putative addiction module component (TIGR02574 family)|uniref:addiction module protein n=1 Tax=Longimicrobium sp. TaxID=2029185 RepID=UPI002EDA4ACF